MGYPADSSWGTNQLMWNALHLDNAAPILNNSLSLPLVLMVGGMYTLGGVTYDDGDAAVMQFTSDGKLMVDTELTLSGVTIDNVKVFSTDGTAANSVYALTNANNLIQNLITDIK